MRVFFRVDEKFYRREGKGGLSVELARDENRIAGCSSWVVIFNVASSEFFEEKRYRGALFSAEN